MGRGSTALFPRYCYFKGDIKNGSRPDLACVRPCREKAAKIAALPYDVYNRKEAKEEVLREPESFLKIDRAETRLMILWIFMHRRSIRKPTICYGI